MKTVLQKYIAQSGNYSRRQAEELVRLGKVNVNGMVAELGMKVDEDDRVEIGRKVVRPIEEKIYIKLNKPRGYTCTNRQFDAEKNVFELLDEEYKGLHIVGRLDKNSHGLVIITNDGEFTAKMTHPRYEHEKEYLIRIKNDEFDGKMIIKKFSEGVDIGDGDGVVKVKHIEQLGDKMFKIILTEGKKRQIRRMFEAVGYVVSDLERVRIGNIVLGDLKAREWELFQLSKS